MPRLTGSRITRQRAVLAGRTLRRRLGAVGGAVIEDQDLQLRVVGGERRRDAGRDDVFFVVGGDEHGHPRPAVLGLLDAGRLFQPAEQQPSRHPQRRGPHRVQGDERQQHLTGGPHTASPAVAAACSRIARTSNATRKDATTVSSPIAIAQLYSNSHGGHDQRTSQRSGPSTNPAMRRPRDAGRSGSKRTDGRPSSLLTTPPLPPTDGGMVPRAVLGREARACQDVP